MSSLSSFSSFNTRFHFVAKCNVHGALDRGHRFANVGVSTPLNLHRKIRALNVLFLRGVIHILLIAHIV